MIQRPFDGSPAGLPFGHTGRKNSNPLVVGQTDPSCSDGGPSLTVSSFRASGAFGELTR